MTQAALPDLAYSRLLSLPPAKAKAQVHKLWGAIVETTERALAGDHPLLTHLGQPVVRRDSSEGSRWWFLGDIHGDFFALHTLLAHVERVDPGASICLLGDVVDRGQDHAECFLLILAAGLERPGRIIWIAGNHDEGVLPPGNDGRFSSKVDPSEFSQWLNADDVPSASTRQRLGHLFVNVVAKLPRAVLFPDGLLASHGGVPLDDRWPQLKSMTDLEAPECLQDFVWTRCADVRKRLVNRNTSGASYGAENLAGFVRTVAPFFPVQRVVRGHDHPQHGAEIPKNFKDVQLITINTFAFDYLAGNPLESSAYRDSLVMGRMNDGRLPEVVNVPWSWEDRLTIEIHRLNDRIEQGMGSPMSNQDRARWLQQTARQSRRLAAILEGEVPQPGQLRSLLRVLQAYLWRRRAEGFEREANAAGAVDAAPAAEAPAAGVKTLQLSWLGPLDAPSNLYASLDEITRSLRVEKVPQLPRVRVRSRFTASCLRPRRTLDLVAVALDGKPVECTARLVERSFEVRGPGGHATGTLEDSLLPLIDALRNALQLSGHLALRSQRYVLPDARVRRFGLLSGLERLRIATSLLQGTRASNYRALAQYARRLAKPDDPEDPELVAHARTWMQIGRTIATPGIHSSVGLRTSPSPIFAGGDERHGQAVRFAPRKVELKAQGASSGQFDAWGVEFLRSLQQGMQNGSTAVECVLETRLDGDGRKAGPAVYIDLVVDSRFVRRLRASPEAIEFGSQRMVRNTKTNFARIVRLLRTLARLDAPPAP